jgi:hypothetical protein
MGANAVTTVPVYTAGEVLTAADLNITNSGIPVFADSTARTNGFGGTGEKVLAEGQFAYLESDNKTYFYDGAAWQAVAGGKIAQVVSTTKTDAFSTTSTSYVDVTGMSVSITPTSATSTILVITGLALSAGAARGYAQLVRGATNIAISTGFATSNQTSVVYENNYQTQYVSIAHVDSPATTSATTYKFQVKADSGSTCFVNAQAGATSHGNVSTLTVMEILA